MYIDQIKKKLGSGSQKKVKKIVQILDPMIKLFCSYSYRCCLTDKTNVFLFYFYMIITLWHERIECCVYACGSRDS